MDTSLKKSLLVVLLTTPLLLTGCGDDSGGSDTPLSLASQGDSAQPSGNKGGGDGNHGGDGMDGDGKDDDRKDDDGKDDDMSDGDRSDANPFIAIVTKPANSEPVPLDDREALIAAIQALFGTAGDEPREPEEVLDLGNE